MLTKEQLKEIGELRKEMRDKFRSVPDSGTKINFLGKDFILSKNVFWPFDDSMPLIENYKVAKGDYVLDVGTGSGAMAIFSAYRGAGKVVAVDINPDAVECAKQNAGLHGFSDVIDVRLSNVFSSIKENEKFDVITANLPFTDEEPSDFVEMAHFDKDLEVHRKFFSGLKKHLKPNGRAFISQANFGPLDKIEELAEENGFRLRLIGKRKMEDNLRVFYCFELTRK